MATKPKGAKGYRWKHAYVRLPQKLREELAVTAGYDDADDKAAASLLQEVEVVLAVQVTSERADRNGPGPSGQAKIWRTVEDAALRLERALHDVDEASYRSLRFLVLVENFDASLLGAIFPGLGRNDAIDTRELSALREVAAEMRKDREAQPGGRRPERARDEAIEMLAEAFHENANIADKGEYREALLDFIRLAFSAVRFSALTREKRWQKIPRALRVPAHRQTSSGGGGRTTRSGPQARRKRQPLKPRP